MSLVVNEILEDIGSVLGDGEHWKSFKPKYDEKAVFDNEYFHSIPRSSGIYEVYTSASIEALKVRGEFKKNDL